MKVQAALFLEKLISIDIDSLLFFKNLNYIDIFLNLIDMYCLMDSTHISLGIYLFLIYIHNFQSHYSFMSKDQDKCSTHYFRIYLRGNNIFIILNQIINLQGMRYTLSLKQDYIIYIQVYIHIFDFENLRIVKVVGIYTEAYYFKFMYNLLYPLSFSVKFLQASIQYHFDKIPHYIYITFIMD